MVQTLIFIFASSLPWSFMENSDENNHMENKVIPFYGKINVQKDKTVLLCRYLQMFKWTFCILAYCNDIQRYSTVNYKFWNGCRFALQPKYVSTDCTDQHILNYSDKMMKIPDKSLQLEWNPILLTSEPLHPDHREHPITGFTNILRYTSQDTGHNVLLWCTLIASKSEILSWSPRGNCCKMTSRRNCNSLHSWRMLEVILVHSLASQIYSLSIK